jgi:hypothetical protein
MNVSVLGGVIFVLVFAGIILTHEFGHFIACRMVGIDVLEFGFGFPPRLWRFWRARGLLVIGKQKVVIPRNMDLPFDCYFGDPAKQKLIQVDVDPRSVGMNRPIAMGIVADAGATIRAPLVSLKELGVKPAGGELVKKYNVAGPRYTSYPPATHFTGLNALPCMCEAGKMPKSS